jgi:hypothetical protein
MSDFIPFEDTRMRKARLFKEMRERYPDTYFDSSDLLKQPKRSPFREAMAKIVKALRGKLS